MSIAGAPPSSASNAEIVRWAFDVLNTHDVTELRPFWNDDTVEHFPNATCRGADEIAGYFEQTFAAIPDFRIEVRSLLGDGDDVFVHWRMTGTHTGEPFAGLVATGRRLELEGMDHFVIRDSLVVSNTVVFDQLSFARQVGFVPADGSPGDRLAKAAFAQKVRLARRLRRR